MSAEDLGEDLGEVLVTAEGITGRATRPALGGRRYSEAPLYRLHPWCLRRRSEEVRLRILYDAWELAPGQGKSLGIYNYAKNLAGALAEIVDEGDHFIVLCNRHNVEDFARASPRIRAVVVPARLPRKIARLAWTFGRAAWWARRLRADVYLSPKGFLPRFARTIAPGANSVVVVHDLIPLWYAEHCPGWENRLVEWVVNGALAYTVRSADRIVAISRATADDIALRLGRVSGVDVVHNGFPRVTPGGAPREGAYIFALTSSVPHKNAAGILEAYRRYRELVESPLPLVVCGLSGPASPGVVPVAGLDDATLHAYYANADLFLFLSLTEGFGFPPVEALSHGTPVVCSDIPALVETTKGLAQCVPPTDLEAVARRMVESLGAGRTALDDARRAAIVREYDWHTCAVGILDVIRAQRASAAGSVEHGE